MSNEFQPTGGYAGYEFVAQIMAMNATYQQPVHHTPYLPPNAATRLTNFKKILLDELNEVDEIVEALDRDDGVPSEVLLTSIADWLGDIIVYCTSEMVKYGLPPLAVLQIIMASNFSKLGEDGLPIVDDTGQKFLKGPNYWKPEPLIEKLLVDLAAYVPQPDVDDNGMCPGCCLVGDCDCAKPAAPQTGATCEDPEFLRGLRELSENSHVYGTDAPREDAPEALAGELLAYRSGPAPTMLMQDAAALIRAQAREIAALRADAERWKWIRANWTRMSCTDNTREGPVIRIERKRWIDWTEEQIDAKVDAARAQEGRHD